MLGVSAELNIVDTYYSTWCRSDRFSRNRILRKRVKMINLNTSLTVVRY
jgi:hypothetical protein